MKVVEAAEEQVALQGEESLRSPSVQEHCVLAATAVQSFTPYLVYLGDSHLPHFGSYLMHGEEIVEDALQLVLLYTPVLQGKQRSTIHHTRFGISLTL